MIATILGLAAEWWHVGGITSAVANVAGTWMTGWRKWALIAGGFAILGLVIFAQHEQHRVDASRLETAEQKIIAWKARFDEEAAASAGFRNQVLELTADRDKARERAAETEKALTAADAKAAAVVIRVQTKVLHDAMPIDSVCSPALAAAIGLHCP